MNLDLKIDNELESNLIKREIVRIVNQNGVQYVFKFDNGYGASIIKHPGSYGYNKDQWELAVINNIDNFNYFNICYDTEITDDVVGFLEDSEVNELLFKIRAL